MMIKLFKWSEDEDNFIFQEEKEMSPVKFSNVIQMEIRPFLDVIHVSDHHLVAVDDWNEDDIFMFVF